MYVQVLYVYKYNFIIVKKKIFNKCQHDNIKLYLFKSKFYTVGLFLHQLTLNKT